MSARPSDRAGSSSTGAGPAHTTAFIEARELGKRYRVPSSKLFQRAGETIALDGVDLSVARGESVAIVGESGSGKSTLLRVLLGLNRASSGSVVIDGREVDPSRDDLLWLRRRSGIVFQDPYSSFDPRRTVGHAVAEPLVAADAFGETRAPGTGASRRADRSVEHRESVTAMLDRLELPAGAADRYPHEFSGGQRQRIAVARALVHAPDLLLADEPVSALDVLVRGRLLELLAELRRDLGLTLLTVTHDLSVVPRIAERIIVMRAGRIVETGTTAQIFEDPRQGYTRALISALPRLPRE